MAVKYNNALPYIQVEAENIHLIIQQHITVVALLHLLMQAQILEIIILT